MDSARIKELGILDSVTDDVSAFIRAVLSDTTKKYFVSLSESTAGKQLYGVLGLENISSRNASASIVMFFAKNGDLGGDACYRDEDREPYYQSALDHLLRYAFFTMDLHRVSLLIPASDTFTEKVAVACQMKQEAILDDALMVDGAFCEAGLFYLLDSEYPDYSVGFVAFHNGVIAIRGGNESVESTRFYEYGQKIEEHLEKSVAIRTGIADEFGVLKPEGAPEYKDLAIMEFPSEVKKCMTEIAEYISKKRTRFTVSAYTPYGSDFQKKVWEKVLKIPYGVTKSYEDIALELTGGDKVTARNLTRAVGAACRDNPLPLLVPCHRVIGKDGKLVGFSGGLKFKEFLLNHEMFGIHIYQ